LLLHDLLQPFFQVPESFQDLVLSLLFDKPSIRGSRKAKTKIVGVARSNSPF
jgi:hypothetical protein